MARVLPQWNGPELEYMNPSQSVESVGYKLVQANYTEEERAHFQSCVDRIPLQDGEPAATVRPFPDPAAATDAVKTTAGDLGADMVGVTHVDPRYAYRGEHLPHRYAVVMTFAMDFEEVAKAPGSETNAEVLRTYDRAGAVGVELARFIRERGYPARAHALRSEQLAMIPHAYAAGLGELGKHGSLINRELGCSFRLGVVTTDLPLVEDTPKAEGIEDFCSRCNMCVTYCPGDAISHEKQEVRGVVKWVVDTEKCAPYWATYQACAICLAVCPVNARALGGRWKADFVQGIKRIDLPGWRARLAAGLQEQWSLVPRPDGD